MTKRILSKLPSAPLVRTAAAVATAAVIAAVVAAAPSFAGSTFLTHKQATKTFLTREEAKTKYAKAKSVPPAPIARAVSSTALFGPINSTSKYEVTGARTTFKTDTAALVTVTFSGTSVCTGTTAGVGCPVQILVDGLPASTSDPKRTDILNFDVASTGNPVPTTHSTTQTTIVTPGQHDVRVQYAGSTKDASLNFKLTSWNLVVNAYPDPTGAPAG